MRMRFATAALTLALLASMHCSAADPTHYFRTREPTARLYVYAGVERSNDDADDQSFLDVPLELRIITPDDLEFAIQTGADRESGTGDDSFEGSDTILSIRKGFRPQSGPDYLSIESGIRIDKSGRARSTGDTFYAAAQAQGGYTRLGFAANVAWNRRTSSETADGTYLLYSLGYRGQFKRWHVGLDVSRVDRQKIEKDNRYLMDAIFMRRDRSGGAFYGVVGKRFSSEFPDWHASLGYELRFDLP